jgi:hypothetical protein
MEDQTGVRVNDKGFTVLFEAESPIIEWVSLFVVLFLLLRVRSLTC